MESEPKKKNKKLLWLIVLNSLPDTDNVFHGKRGKFYQINL